MSGNHLREMLQFKVWSNSVYILVGFVMWLAGVSVYAAAALLLLGISSGVFHLAKAVDRYSTATHVFRTLDRYFTILSMIAVAGHLAGLDKPWGIILIVGAAAAVVGIMSADDDLVVPAHIGVAAGALVWLGFASGTGAVLLATFGGIGYGTCFGIGEMYRDEHPYVYSLWHGLSHIIGALTLLLLSLM